MQTLLKCKQHSPETGASTEDMDSVSLHGTWVLLSQRGGKIFQIEGPAGAKVERYENSWHVPGTARRQRLIPDL